VHVRSESPQLVSWRSARVRAVATIAGSLGKVQEATWSSRSTEVRASRRTTFSAARDPSPRAGRSRRRRHCSGRGRDVQLVDSWPPALSTPGARRVRPRRQCHVRAPGQRVGRPS
jgi:hypothetical protein